jgi:hypothetical protein
MRRLCVYCLIFAAALRAAPAAEGACCYFSAQNTDILQPAQKVFITWDPQTQTETFTVQPKFEGNALDFGMVIPTPTQPKLHEMPRDMFKHLAVYTILKHRQYPKSKILPVGKGFGLGGGKKKGAGGDSEVLEVPAPKRPAVVVLETGVVGSLDYKIIKADRADDLYQWLKDNKYRYAGDEATLDYYVKKNYVFTVMKIDTMQMKKNKDGSYTGEVTPTRFQFTSEKLMYPLKITQISVKDKTEALFYVQAPHKVDLAGDKSYQFIWVQTLQGSTKYIGLKQPGRGKDYLTAISDQIPALLNRSNELGYKFVRGQRPTPNANGVIPTTMEWARKLTDKDIDILSGKAPFTDTLPSVDDGFTKQDYDDPAKRAEVAKTIRARMIEARKKNPLGYMVREAPAEDVRALQQLMGHLRAGLFVTKFRKIFTRGEMNDDLELVAARVGQHEDASEYEEILPASPP